MAVFSDSIRVTWYNYFERLFVMQTLKNMNANPKRRPQSTRPSMASTRGPHRFRANRPVLNTPEGIAASTSASAKPLRILIADDHVLLRELLAAMVSGKGPCCDVVAQAGNAAEAIARVRNTRPISWCWT